VDSQTKYKVGNPSAEVSPRQVKPFEAPKKLADSSKPKQKRVVKKTNINLAKSESQLPNVNQDQEKKLKSLIKNAGLSSKYSSSKDFELSEDNK
jgi:hypothetical protein